MENYEIIKLHAQLKYRRAGMRNNESIHSGLMLFIMLMLYHSNMDSFASFSFL